MGVCGWMEGGAGGWLTGIIVVRVCKSLFRNLHHSYICTWLLENGPIHILDPFIYCPLIFLYPFIAGSQKNIALNSLITKRTSGLKKSLCKKKKVHMPGCQKCGAFHIPIIYFLKKKRGLIIHLAALKALTSVLCHI